MKYVSISRYDKLNELTERYGLNNINQILADNGITRAPNVGQQFYNLVQNAIKTTPPVSGTRKLAILSQYVNDSDIYEKAALSDTDEWKVLSTLNTFSDYLYVSDQIEDQIIDTYQTLGNGISVSSQIRKKVESAILLNDEKILTSDLFSAINTSRNIGLRSVATSVSKELNPMDWFNIPDNVVLYSSITGDRMIIPTYPTSYHDERIANYTTMPDLLYQYEPWQMYQSSGPRSNNIEFHLHRDMWTGNHLDGKANELIRFCQAQCYPIYNGSTVVAPTVTLYVDGSQLITGVMTNVGIDWQGPIGQDSWYLEFTLTLSITEVSPSPLNHTAMLSKGLIG